MTINKHVIFLCFFVSVFFHFIIFCFIFRVTRITYKRLPVYIPVEISSKSDFLRQHEQYKNKINNSSTFNNSDVMDNLNKKDNIKKFNNIKQKGNILINEKNNKDQEAKKIKFDSKSAYDDNAKNLKYSDNNLKSAYDDNAKNLKYSDNNLKSAYDDNAKNLKYSDNNLKSAYDDNAKNLKYLDNNSDIKNAGYSQGTLSFDTSDFKHSYYAETIVKKISEQWKLVENYNQLSTIIYFKINRNGSIFNVSIKKSSGNKEYDRYALDAIHRIAFFPNLPDDYKSNELGVYFEFKCRG